MVRANGVLPDAVIRNHHAEALFVFATLRPDLDRDGVQTWLRCVSDLLWDMQRPRRGHRDASVVVGFGQSFFVAANGEPRFGLTARAPVGLQMPLPIPTPPSDNSGASDVVFYVMTLSEATAMRFLEGLSRTRSLGLATTAIERGFQRDDGRELFGFRDGLRNVPRQRRNDVIFVDRDTAPDEPDWCQGGSYLAYLKLRQDFDAWHSIPEDEQERIIGRRKGDGSRLDLPPGTNARHEEESSFDSLPPNSHVRKVGPRDSTHSPTLIFRRGVPYLGLRDDGAMEGGLQFVSFQSSIDSFDVVLRHWALQPEFPRPSSGPDALFGRGLVTIQKAGVYFAAPRDSRFIGAGMFDAPRHEPVPRRQGRLVIRKSAVDGNGALMLGELAGVGFQVIRVDNNEPIGGIFFTDAAGHAVSPDLPVRTGLVLREVQTPPHFEPQPDVPFQLQRRREVLRVINRARATGY